MDPNNLVDLTTVDSYYQLYSNPDSDEYEGNYASVMNLFRTNTNPQPINHQVNLHRKVFDTAERQVHAYLTLTKTLEDKAHVRVVHRPSRYVPPLGATEDDHDLGLSGDVRGRIPPRLVLWPEQAFLQTDALNVPTYNALDTIFAADPNVEMAGPFANGAAGTTAITTLKMMYLPPKYIEHVLTTQLTPREAWVTLSPILRSEPLQTQEDCRPLLNWLAATCTKYDEAIDIPITRVTLRVPEPLTSGLQDHFHEVLTRDLPGWNTTTSHNTNRNDPVVDAVNNLAAELVRTRNEEALRRTADKTKTPTDYFGDALLTLHRFTHTATEAALPPVYTTIANTTKKNLRTVLSEKLRSTAHEMGQEFYAPLLTPELANRIATLQFVHPNKDDLSGGIQPFVTPPLTSQEISEASRHIDAYDTIIAGTAAQLSDLQRLQQAHKVRLPRSILQVGHQFKSFGILLRVLLGEYHTLVTVYSEFVGQYDAMQTHLEPHATTYEYPAQIVRWVQLRISNWFNRQSLTPARVPPPSLMLLFDHIENEEPWKPQVPGSPTVPTASTAPNPGAPTREREGDRTRVANNNYDATFQPFKDGTVTLGQARERARTANSPIPTNRHGTEMCLSYHVLGFCWSNCTRAQDHCTLASRDKTKLKEWCDQHYT